MAQIAKTKYAYLEVSVDTHGVEENLKDADGRTTEKYIGNHNYYNQKNFKFAFCESCYWFASILKDVFNYNQCPRCENKMYIEKILKK
jgi:hypothetical protein